MYSTIRPGDIKTPYEKMLGNNVEFGSPDKRSGGFFSSGFVRPPHFLLYMLLFDDDDALIVYCLFVCFNS